MALTWPRVTQGPEIPQHVKQQCYLSSWVQPCFLPHGVACAWTGLLWQQYHPQCHRCLFHQKQSSWDTWVWLHEKLKGVTKQLLPPREQEKVTQPLMWGKHLLSVDIDLGEWKKGLCLQERQAKVCTVMASKSPALSMPWGHSVDLSMTQEELDMSRGFLPLFYREGLSTDSRSKALCLLLSTFQVWVSSQKIAPSLTKGLVTLFTLSRIISSENNLNKPFRDRG